MGLGSQAVAALAARRSERRRLSPGGRGTTEGGEALPATILEQETLSTRDTDKQPWYVLWTHSHCEQLVHDQLATKGFEIFLPKMTVWSRLRGAKHLVEVPMFPGYLFLRHTMDKASYLDVCRVRGLVRVLGTRWDELSTVPEGEVEAIHRVLDAGCQVRPHRYLQVGQRVRITQGPLADIEGILLRAKPNKGLLVLSIGLLRRAVAVEVDCTLVTAA
jgi:transcription termination/antitermination protein NusG